MQDITACVCLGEGEGWKTVKKQMCAVSHLSDLMFVGQLSLPNNVPVSLCATDEIKLV